MSTGSRVPLTIAQEVARLLMAELAPACDRIMVAGSIRRGAADVGDIELVAIPKPAVQPRLVFGQNPKTMKPVSPLDEALEKLLKENRIRRTVPPGIDNRPAWGDRYKKFWLKINRKRGLIQVDLFITSAEQWGAIFAIRTGPQEFNEALMAHINAHTAYRQNAGYLTLKATGEPVVTRTEQDYFRLIGVPFIPPAQRTAAELRRVLAAARRRAASRPAPAPRNTVKTLSLWQPWASLVAAGLKTYETRDWTTSYRGLLAIHAAMRESDDRVLNYLTPEQRSQLPGVMPRGAMLCIVRLVDIVPTGILTVDETFEDSLEFSLGDYSPGRFAWKLELVQVFEQPIPAVGKQGLFNWPVPEEAKAKA